MFTLDVFLIIIRIIGLVIILLAVISILKIIYNVKTIPNEKKRLAVINKYKSDPILKEIISTYDNGTIWIKKDQVNRAVYNMIECGVLKKEGIKWLDDFIGNELIKLSISNKHYELLTVKD